MSTEQLIAQLDEARAALRQVLGLFETDFYIKKMASKGGMTNADQDRISEVFVAVKAALEETDASER